MAERITQVGAQQADLLRHNMNVVVGNGYKVQLHCVLTTIVAPN